MHLTRCQLVTEVVSLLIFVAAIALVPALTGGEPIYDARGFLLFVLVWIAVRALMLFLEHRHKSVSS